MKQDTLQQRIYDKKSLTDNEIDDLVSLLGKGCRAKRKAQIRMELEYTPDIESFGIYGRVLVTEDINGKQYGASYCAGQDYTSELATVRECLTGR